jgi:16S rRNA G1207 methylase RsmC
MNRSLHELKKDIVFEARMRDRDLKFRTTWGLFSPREIDEGSSLLVKYVDVEIDDVTIDVGCGYGAVGIPIAASSPKGEVHMVDKDFVAVEYAEKNAKVNRLSNCQAYLSNGFSNVDKNLECDNVVSNLPAKVGKEMIYIMLRDAKTRLKPGGKIWVVVISGLKDYIKREFKNVFGNYDKVKQGRKHAVLSAQKHPGNN